MLMLKINMEEIEIMVQKSQNQFDKNSSKIAYGQYNIGVPLIKPSKLTYVEKGGIGKELSDGWAINYAVGCTHAC